MRGVPDAGARAAGDGGVMASVSEHEPLRIGAATAVVLADGAATGGAYTQFEISAPAGTIAPRRTHAFEDLGIHVLEGVLDVELDGRRLAVRPGTSVMLPRGLPHSAVVVSPQARVLVTCTPAGLERLGRVLADGEGEPPPVGDDLAALLAMAGVQPL
jgi:quercetin dioxygenase-like cupin family protein